MHKPEHTTRKETSRPRRLIALLMAFMLCFSCVCTAMAEGTEERTVRMGVFSLGNFQALTKTRNGVYGMRGYNADYIRQVTQKSHWKMVYVPCDNWVDGIAKLENGEIDLLAPAQITDELREKFDYSALYMGSESAAIYALSGSKVNYEDYNAMGELVYGCAENSTFASRFVDEYCVSQGISPTIKTYANTTELQNALTSGEVDAIVTNIMFASEKYKLLDWFLVLPVYYITQKGNTELLAELDEAMRALLMEKPTLISDLANKYFPVYGTTNITAAEHAYIAQLPELTVGYEQNHKPLSYTGANGQFAGITRSILDRISEITGIRFNYVELPATDVSWQYLIDNQIRVLSNVEYNETNLAIPQMHISMPFLESDKVLVAKQDLNFHSGAELTIGVPTGSGTLATAIREVYPNFTVEEFATVEECFDAMNAGKLDGTMVNRYIADCALEKPVYADLSVLPIQSISDRLCIASLDFNDGTEINTLLNDSMFVSIMDKAIEKITTDEKNGYIITNTSNARYSLTFGDFVQEYSWQLMGGVLALGLILTLLIWLAAVRQHSAEKLSRANAILEKAIAKAESANAAKTQFLAQMSHEIRTPMNAIIGLTSIAKTETQYPQKMTDCLSKIESSSQMLLNIINDVLDMSAIEGGKLKIDKRRFNIKTLLSNLTTVFYQQAKQKNIGFRVRLNAVTEEQLIGDELRLNQILMNLLSNAVKFTSPGGEIDLMVLQASRSKDKVQMRFSVSDTGCGMSEDMMNRMFLPFEQESASTARKHGGSGLGLSITKNLVEMMGGSIKVDSRLGKGSVFSVDIPFGMEHVDYISDVTNFSSIRTLVVDDDKESCEYCGILLERLGVHYNYALTGDKALDMLGEAEEAGDPYKLCLVDWKMPDMDGVEVTRKIREIFGEDTIVIIATV